MDAMQAYDYDIECWRAYLRTGEEKFLTYVHIDNLNSFWRQRFGVSFDETIEDIEKHKGTYARIHH